MATSTQLPLAEYLETTYHPDREYIDGELLERNVGKWEHSRIQLLIGAWFAIHERQWQVMTATEARMRVGASRIRIPDVTIVRSGPQPEVITEPPVLVIEILSPDDTYADTQRRARDYQAMGIGTIWIIDPETRSGRVCTGDTWTAASRLEVPGTPIFVDLDGIFASLQQPL